MRTVVAAAVSLAFASSLESQIVATLNRSPAGVPEVRIRNNGKVSLAAFAAAMNPSRDSEDQTQFVEFFDTVVDHTAPLEPDHEHTLPVRFRSRPGRRIEELFEPPVMAAGILSDGGTTGDAVLLTRLMLRRNNMLLAVETAIETLSDAGRRNIPRDQLIEQFRKLADALWRWYVPPEQQVGRAVYRSIIEKLRNIPEGPVGSPFPPSAFVADETIALNRQRVALLNSQPGLAAATLIRGR
jgi:hypothetical protein